jgi:hypothetical protein
MSRTLYAVLQETRHAASNLRQSTTLDAELADRLARFEAAIDHALASSPDGATVAHPEEYVALDALCDLHLALQTQPLHMRERLRPIIDEWIAYAASTGLTPQEFEAAHRDAASTVDGWIESVDSGQGLGRSAKDWPLFQENYRKQA